MFWHKHSSNAAETNGPDESRDNKRVGNLDGRQSELQERTVRSYAFPRILEQVVDAHPKDGWPDAPFAALGSRYQLVQMLSLRDPLDARYINDSHQVPYWLRTTANLPTSVGGTGETQRMGLSPQPPLSPYQVEDWKQQLYNNIPLIGKGPGTAFVVPASQISD
jgi:hypothetical protein